MTIDTIVVHHSGAIGNNDLASSRHLTVDDIDSYHKSKWNFPSLYMKKGKGPYYVGYNVVYDPKTRQFTQTRAIGEETIHTKGLNYTSFGLCIIGNYTMGVDAMGATIEDDISGYLDDLINGNRRGLVVAPNTKLSLSVSRIYPHRAFSQTQCYGSSLSNNWARDCVTKVTYSRIIQQLLSIYGNLQSLLNTKHLGGVDEECTGGIEKV